MLRQNGLGICVYRFKFSNIFFSLEPFILLVCLDRTYFTETENWKHCSKIIFKCVNSTVGPIFNEKIVKKWYLWIRKQCTDTLFTIEKSTFADTVHEPFMNNSRITPWNAWKKKSQKTQMQNVNVESKQHLCVFYIVLINIVILILNWLIFLRKFCSLTVVGK